MSTGIVVSQVANTGISVGQTSIDNAMMRELAGGGGSFIPRIQFYTNASEVVKKGNFPMNSYGIPRSKDEITDLGKNVDVAVITFRSKAMDLSQGDPLTYYNFHSDDFQRVKNEANKKSDGFMFGLEFLFWIPSVSEFCTFFAYNVSSKNEAKKIVECVGKVVNMTSVYVERTKNSFQAIKAILSSSPLETVPSDEDLEAILEKFNNPVDSSATSATADEAASQNRAQ